MLTRIDGADGAKAEAASEHRLDAHNQFRAVITEQSATLITRTEVMLVVTPLRERIEELCGRLDRIEGTKAKTASWWQYIFGVLATAAAIISAIGLAR